MIKAEIIADSINAVTRDRITSFVISIPRIVLAEFNTHRMISRNSASSRAIPFEKMLERVQNEPFIPMKFQKDHSGMQGTEYLEGKEADRAKGHWLRGRDKAVDCARRLNVDCGVTKQIANRMLETYMYHTIICTATEWANFMALRAHPAAEIHIAKAAELMLEAMNASTPKELKPGEWHVPFGNGLDVERISALIDKLGLEPFTENAPENLAVRAEEHGKIFDIVAIKIATARCARVSYQNYEGGDDYDKDVALHDRLSSMGHWSPFEHCAQAMIIDSEINDAGMNIINGKKSFGWYGNFRGFQQYRKMFEGENKSDERLIKK